MTINERIAEIRKDLGLTQTAFGQRIGVSRDTIANLEGGRSAISDLQKTAICREYNISMDWLETGEGEMKILPLDEDMELAMTLKKLGKRAPVEIVKVILKMYEKLDDAARDALDESIIEAVLAIKKDPE